MQPTQHNSFLKRVSSGVGILQMLLQKNVDWSTYAPQVMSVPPILLRVIYEDKE